MLAIKKGEDGESKRKTYDSFSSSISSTGGSLDVTSLADPFGGKSKEKATPLTPPSATQSIEPLPEPCTPPLSAESSPLKLKMTQYSPGVGVASPPQVGGAAVMGVSSPPVGVCSPPMGVAVNSPPMGVSSPPMGVAMPSPPMGMSSPPMGVAMPSPPMGVSSPPMGVAMPSPPMGMAMPSPPMGMSSPPMGVAMPSPPMGVSSPPMGVAVNSPPMGVTSPPMGVATPPSSAVADYSMVSPFKLGTSSYIVYHWYIDCLEFYLFPQNPLTSYPVS